MGWWVGEGGLAKGVEVVRRCCGEEFVKGTKSSSQRRITSKLQSMKLFDMLATMSALSYLQRQCFSRSVHQFADLR